MYSKKHKLRNLNYAEAQEIQQGFADFDCNYC
jgi:hypothetical protein